MIPDDKIIAALHKHHGLIAVAARALGCQRSTIYRRIEQSPEIKEALEEARAAMTEHVESKLYENIDAGDQRAIEFYLKNKQREYSDKLQVGGIGGGPVEFEVVHHVLAADVEEEA